MRSALALLVMVALVSGGGVARAEEADPGELWSEYPLDPSTTASPPPTTTAQQPPATQPAATTPTRTFPAADPGAATGVIEAPADEDRISGIAAIVALVAGAFVVVTLIFFATRFLTESLLFAVTATAKGVPAMSKLFRRRDAEDETPAQPQEATAEDEGASGRPLADMVTSYTAYRATVAEPMPSQQAAPQPTAAATAVDEAEAEAEPEPDRARTVAPAKYADLGNRIADVLRVAEESSEQLLADARAEAERIRREAEAEAREVRTRVQEETEGQRSELARVRSEAEAYVEQRRQAANEEAGTIRAEAESEARALREAGEEIRRRLEQEGLSKQQQLRAASSSIEARLREALDTSRSVAAEIERLLNGKGTTDEDDATLAERLELQQRGG